MVKPNQPTRLQNHACPYCGLPLTKATRNKEHVIGRRFVPKGKLHNSWNVILWTCRPCNLDKSRLEDDISAIAMQPDAFGGHPVDDAVLRSDASRKAATSRSERTHKPVADSSESLTLNMLLGASTIGSISLIAPPQVNEARLFELARYHLLGFFSFLTYNENSGCTSSWPGGFHPIIAVRRADWGNRQVVSFMRSVVTWPLRLVSQSLSDEYFKVAIRKHPTLVLWSWALEWNQSFRLVGYIGDESAAKVELASIERGNVREYPRRDGSVVRVREDVSLGDAEDVLFSISTELNEWTESRFG